MDSKIDGLMVLEAQPRSSSIDAGVPAQEIAAAITAGTIVVVKGAFDPREMQRLRGAIRSANIPICERSFDNDWRSWRDRRDEYVGTEHCCYEASFLAVTKPDDEIGRAVSATVERLAAFWRALTGYAHTFVTEEGRRALRAWCMYYPAGGGCFGWHNHGLEPTRIGFILALSEIGDDFQTGGTEFRTPFGLVNVAQHHDIGDLCLFRYDLPHRVTAVDPDLERRWDGAGRWALIIQGDPRPPDETTPGVPAQK